MTEYFIYHGQSQHCPLTFEQLKTQKLTNNTFVWYEGLQDWSTIGNIPELKSLVASKPIPPPLNNGNAVDPYFVNRNRLI
ncbi:DUF4339 domain-containing protein [Terrimonas alba]|uniref:DUF4339 domain-containing protein n=1 Tax=Terrimonas alba TaxID=3349636 RepID=UPI0035F2E65D